MLNFFNLISVLKTIFSFASQLITFVKDLIIKGKQKKEVQEAEGAAQEYNELNTIEDEHERLKKKAEAACKLEKSLNPDADCSL